MSNKPIYKLIDWIEKISINDHYCQDYISINPNAIDVGLGAKRRADSKNIAGNAANRFGFNRPVWQNDGQLRACTKR